MGIIRDVLIDRYLFYSILAMILGIYSSWYRGRLEIFFFMGIFLFIFKDKKRYITVIILFFIIGNIYSGYFLNKTIEENLKNVKTEVLIRIETNKGDQYIGKILNNISTTKTSHLLKKKIIFYYPDSLKIGSIYQGKFIMDNFEIQRIPKGFNEKMYYFSNNIFYKGNVSKLETKDDFHSFFAQFVKYRKEVMDKYVSRFTSKAQGLVQAIIFGDKSLFSQETRDSFQILGISHLLAVSGLHGGIIAAGAYKLFSPWGFYVKNWAAWFFLILYAFLAGFSPSINRAALMFFIFSLRKIFLRYPDSLTIIALSALPQILYNPFVVFSAGFQLSYITVMGIVFFHKNKKSSLSISLAAVAGTLPILVIYFNKISLIGVFINLFYVPLFAIVTLLAMLGLFFPFMPLLYCYDYLLNMIIEASEKIASYFQFMDISISSPLLWEIILYYVLIFLIYYNKEIKRSLLIFLLVFLLIVSFYPKKWEVIFIDVGQGDSAFISTKNEKIILIDGGPWGNEVDGFLSSKGINRPELYIVSHGDSDHINGIIWLMKTKAPKNILLPTNCESNELIEELLILAQEEKVNVIYGYAGQKFYIDDTKFEILSPRQAQVFTDANNHSLVILVTYENKRILFTGDIEKQVMETLKIEEHIDLLKVPHHGSNSGNSRSFYKNIEIDVGLVSCGQNNRYGHPGDGLIKLLEENKIKVIRTDKKGTISFIYKGEKEFYYKTILD